MLKRSLRGQQLYKEKVQVPVKELRIGMYVSELDIPWSMSPFLVKGFRIADEQQIRTLRSISRHVYIDIVKSKLQDVQAKSVNIQPPCHETSEKALEKAKPIYAQSTRLLSSIFKTKHLSMADIDEAKSLVGSHVDGVLANPAALRWLSISETHSLYLIDHSIKVTILSLMLGIEVGLSRDDLETLGLAALLHDVGMLNVPQSILNKKEALSIEETSLIQKHPLFASKMLDNEAMLPREVVEVIAAHHERLDGQGYPLGLKSYDIPELSKIIAIADTFDGQTSHRSYHSSSSSLDALRTLMALRNSHFEEKLVIKFIRVIGVYPVGSIVELSDQRIGIVLPTLSEDKMKPKVLIVRNPDKTECDIYTLELSKEADLKVANLLPDGHSGVNLIEYAHKVMQY